MITSVYSEYIAKKCAIKELFVRVSDGVQLKVIDSKPESDFPGKPVIVFVAGWLSHISAWKGVLQVLTSYFRVVYIETREKNSSIFPIHRKTDFSMERLAKDISEIIYNMIPSKRRFILAGSSLGATAILEFLFSSRRQPLAAILVAPNAKFEYPRFLMKFIIPLVPPSAYVLIKPFIKWYLRNFRLDKEKETDQIKKYESTLDSADPYKLKPNAMAILNYSAWNKLPAISTPILLLGGTTDKLHKTDYLKKMADLLPHACYQELSSNKETHSETAGELMVKFINRKDYLEL